MYQLWMMKAMEAMAEHPVFVHAHTLVHEWRAEHPFGWDRDAEPETLSRAVATVASMRIQAMEQGGADYQQALDAWRAEAERQGAGQVHGLAPWPDAVRKRIGTVLDYPETVVVDGAWLPQFPDGHQ